MSEDSLSIPSLHSSLAISDNTTTMSKAPQDSQATIPFDPQEEQEFSCGQQISSSNPESVVSDDDKDQLSDDSDGEWTGLELPDISPASEPTTVIAEGSSQHGELSQTFNSSQTAKRRRESETVDLVSVEDPALPMPLFLQSQYQRTATHVMALTDRIARLETGSQAYRVAVLERRMLQEQASSILDILYPTSRVNPELRMLVDMFREYGSKRTKLSN